MLNIFHNKTLFRLIRIKVDTWCLCLGCKTRTATQAGYFAEKFDRIMQGEAHSDPIKHRRQDRLKEKKKQITEKPFMPSNPSAKYSGTGSGTFSGKIDAFKGSLIVTNCTDWYAGYFIWFDKNTI